MVFQSIREVLKNPAYATISVITSALIFVVALLIPNIELVGIVFESSVANLAEKFGIIASLLGSITTSFTFYSATILVLIAVLSGLNLSMSIYLFRTKASGLSQNVLGFLGFGTGAVGIGCSACGSIALASFIGGTLTFLPFAGAEFGLVGIILLVISIRSIGIRISKPLVCEIK
jgi:hypothetical protein